MMVGILDFRRRHYVASKLDELLRTGAYTGSQHIRTPGTSESLTSGSLSWLKSMGTNSSSSRGGKSSSQGGSSRGSSSLTGQGIVVDFHDPMSLQAWWICRVLAHDFGQGFHKRIKVSFLISFLCLNIPPSLFLLLVFCSIPFSMKSYSCNVEDECHIFAKFL